MWGNVLGLFYSHWDMQLFQQHLLKTPFSPVNYCGTFVEDHLNICMWIYFWIILLPHHSLITVAFNLEIKKWKSTNFVLTVSLTIFQVTYISTQTLKSTCQFLEIDGNIRIMSGLSMEQFWENWHHSNTEFSHPWTDHISPFI